jgi:hypothetical protein
LLAPILPGSPEHVRAADEEAQQADHEEEQQHEGDRID